MGTRLVLPDRNWDPDSGTNMGAWVRTPATEMRRALALKHKATFYKKASGLSSDEEDRGWGQISQDFYGTFLKALQTGLQDPHNGVDGEVWAIGYDWRQPNRKSAGAVLRRIKEIQALRKPDRTIIVTHSMGGLVSRHLTMTKGASELIEGVIHIGQPVTGAVLAYRRLLGGAPRKVDGLAMRLLLGSNPEQVATIVSGLPSYFELLPTDEYRHSTNPSAFWLQERASGTEFVVTPGPDETIYDVYLRDRWPPSVAPLNLPPALRKEIKSRTAHARKSHSHIAGNAGAGTPPKCHKATWSLLSSKEMTDTTFLAEHQENKRPRVHFSEGRAEAGDGTVPAASASALFPGEGGPLNHTPDPLLNRQFFVDGLVHDVMCEDADLQAGVLQLILAILSPPMLNVHGSGATKAGRITFDQNVVWDKIAEVKAGGTKGKEAAAELRVAKFFAQRGHDVHLLAKRNSEATPDMQVARVGNVEVKRFIKFDEELTTRRLRHAIEQVEFNGGTGLVVAVHSKDADLDFEAYHSAIHRIVRKGLNGVARGVVDLVVSEDTLPPVW